MKIGVVGLGNIGKHLASNLLRAGFDVSVHDLDRTAAEPLIALGALWADSPAAVAATTDSVITCLPSVAAITTVVAGDRGLIEGFGPGSTWIDMSTNERHELLRLAELLAARGVHTLEAPVTGGAHNASSATITVLVGGDEATFERHRNVFEAVGGRVFFLGELGQAAVIKVITNMLAFIHIAATAEAYMLAARAGIDRGEQEGQRHAIGADHLVVVPDGAPGHAVRRDDRVQPQRFLAGHDASVRQVRARIRQPLVAIACDGVVDGQCEAHQQRTAPGVPRGRHDERHGPDQVRQDPRQRAPLADEQPHLPEIHGLQRTQAAMQGLEVVERRGRAEVVLVDDGDRQAPLRGIPCRRDAIEAGADDDHVEF